jgi:hypothetical protein
MKVGAQGIALLLACFALAMAGCAGDPGANGSSCTVTANPDAGTSSITCTDGTSVTVNNGTAGTPGTPGSGCTVTTAADGTKTITCDDGTTATITNGDAASCTVTTDATTGVQTITCSDGSTATVSNGTAGMSCTVTPGPATGQATISCDDGTSYVVANGATGASGGNVRVTDFHGRANLLSTGEYANGVKYFANATIDSATADAAGVVTVNFTVRNRPVAPATVGTPITNIPSVGGAIAKLVPAGATDGSNRWVSYIYTKETVGAGTFPMATGTSTLEANRESSGTTATTGRLTNHGDGTYTYVYVTNLATATLGPDAGAALVGYDRTLTHRAYITMGGHAGATADAYIDFRPDAVAVTETRNLMPTSTCQNCHSENQFAGHGGDRLTLEGCAVCHSSGAVDAQGGQSLDLRTMIHKIHAGGELPSVRGADGIVWDNPTTTVNEAADNGSYAIWGYRTTRYSWEKVGFPAVLDNCTKCHEGTGAQVDNWKTNPSRAACGSCHDTSYFAVVDATHPLPAGMTVHSGGARAADSSCAGCHDPDQITAYHDFMTRDQRNTPEFNATLTVNTPPRGYFIAGEAPIVTIALTDATTGAVIDGTTIIEDTTARASTENCTATACAARNTLFRSASFFVHGPRGRNVPVLTTAARAQILSTGTGPWTWAAATSLALKIDAGLDVHRTDITGGDYLALANISVPIPAGTYTVAQLVTLLNGNTAFKRRAVAFDQGGQLGIRSRNLGWLYSVQLVAGTVTTDVFAGDVTAHVLMGSNANNNVSARAVPANNDPKATRTATGITYQLDAVDDLLPGTYLAQIEFTDRGRQSATDYWTPTVAFATIQVGVATEEAPIARNCQSCHQSNTAGLGTGMVVDVSRHNKYLRDLATDQCNGCHDYMPQYADSATDPGSIGFSGTRPTSRRVHAIHYGSSLNYPLATVDYRNGDPVPGRNWDITLPQDVRECETCHTATTSGTWATRPGRLACSGCHDSDAAAGHLRLQTYDPTPAAPWSGDEIESCQTCH